MSCRSAAAFAGTATRMRFAESIAGFIAG